MSEESVVILGIETSCDETSAAIVRNGREVLANTISTQMDLHKQYGGVVPEIASRRHIESILPVIEETLKEAKLTLEELDAIAVTYAPGLVGALLVGVSTAKALSFSLKKPLLAVHHIEGHIAANYIAHPGLKPPYICLVVSGGHTLIVYVKDYTCFEIVGKTRDDAAGEAFDKVARTLNLGYPGGPIIEQLARKGNANAVHFPRTYFRDNSLDFSFSGIKTSVLQYVRSREVKHEEIVVEDIAASFQQAVLEVLVKNTLIAAKSYGVDTVAISGGVAANRALCDLMEQSCDSQGVSCVYPSVCLCTDNAAMIAAQGYQLFTRKKYAPLDLNAIPYLKVGEKS